MVKVEAQRFGCWEGPVGAANWRKAETSEACLDAHDWSAGRHQMPKRSLQKGWEETVAERKLGSRGKKMARSRHVAIHLWVYHIYSMSDVSNGLMEMDGCVFNGIKYMLSFIITTKN
jgi:hypothetical protein